MNNVLFILMLSIGSVAFGYFVKRMILALYSTKTQGLLDFSKKLKLITMFVINPIPILSSFWTFSFQRQSILFFPFLGILFTIVSALGTLIFIKVFSIESKKAASVFCSGMFSNIMTFGGLTAFILFGVEGYSLIQLFNLFIGPINYLVGYPMSYQISIGGSKSFKLSTKVFKSRPYVLIPITALLIGMLFNTLGVKQPVLVPQLRSMLIPFVTGSMGVSIGLTLNLGRITSYIKEIGVIFLIKFLVSPLVMAFIAYVFGLHTMMNGIPFKVTVIASAMPVAFNALIPPSIYGFDLDLANSAWVTTTLAFAVVLPILYVVLRI